MDDKDILTEAKERFSLSQDAESENRKAWEEDVAFARLAQQWPEKVKQQREREGRPCLTINRLPAFIRQVINDARMNTPQIKFHPVDDGADKETAEILNGLAKNIEYSSDADVAYDTALESAVTGGFGYFRITMDYAFDDVFDMDIKIERIANPLTVYGDHASEAADASDWRYGFVTEIIPKEEFEATWKGKEKVDWDSYGDGKELEWFQDDSVRIAEYWKREEVTRTIVLLSSGNIISKEQFEENAELFNMSGITIAKEREAKSYKVTQYIMTGAEILETNEWPGQYIPIVPVYGDEVFLNGKRHLSSLVRHAKDSQMQYNVWRSSATEQIAMAPRVPFIGPKGAFATDAEKWATANNVSHAYIEYDGATPPQRQPLDTGAGISAMNQALSASDDMKAIMGIFDASLGMRSNETSGKAILARQREGDVSTFNFIDNLSRAIRYAGRVLADLIPHVYDSARIVRVIGEDDSVKSVPINQEGPEGAIYNLTKGKYDVTVESGPSFTTKREESATQMVEFMRSFPAAAGVIGDLVAKNLDWPGADQISARLKMMLPPPIQQMESNQAIPPQAQAMVAALQGQLEQMQQGMQKASQQMQQLAQENQQLKLANANKQNEIQAKFALQEQAGQQAIREIIVKAMADAQAAQASEIRDMVSQQIANAMHPQPIEGADQF